MTKNTPNKPFAVRLPHEVRTALTKRAGSRPLGAYICTILTAHAEQETGQQTTKIKPTELAQCLAMLGKSGAAENLRTLAEVARHGLIAVQTEQKILKACDDIAAMKRALMQALGIKEE